MKIILGDNQFFGVNHADLNKGSLSKQQFSSQQAIYDFIRKSVDTGIDGLMLNSNSTAIDLLNTYNINLDLHYSVPYPHKFASMVNENGLRSIFGLMRHNLTISDIPSFLKFIYSKDLMDAVEICIKLELPKKNRQSIKYIYLQNIITDMLIASQRVDLLEKFCLVVRKLGFNPALITLNPTRLDELLQRFNKYPITKELIVCFNYNLEGFNVFPDLKQVEQQLASGTGYSVMLMSIFASGSTKNDKIFETLKSLKPEYVVFGTSSLSRLRENIAKLRE